jgi:hypothetical protein
MGVSGEKCPAPGLLEGTRGGEPGPAALSRPPLPGEPLEVRAARRTPTTYGTDNGGGGRQGGEEGGGGKEGKGN